MNRLTMWYDGNHAICENEECSSGDCPFADPICEQVQNIIDRLAAIEDILGDDYDLDRLCELARADKLIGKTVWLTKWFTKNVQIANPPLQRTIIYISVCKNGEILMHIKDGAFPIQLIGDCAFTSQEEAQAALRREQNG